MIDIVGRRELSEKLRHLVNGRIASEEFTDAQPRGGTDPALHEVWKFGWGLYSDNRPPYLLRGEHALPAEAKRIAARAVLFLRSDLEYEWPEVPWLVGRTFAFLFGWLPVFVAALILATWGSSIAAVFLFVIAVLIAAAGLIGVKRGWVFRSSARWRIAQETIDWNIWPFYRCDDFEKARRSRCLLGGRPSVA
jgi:hypothetical protein